MRLVINSVRSDLTSRNEAFQCLALTFIANSECAFYVLDDLGDGGEFATITDSAPVRLPDPQWARRRWRSC